MHSSLQKDRTGPLTNGELGINPQPIAYPRSELTASAFRQRPLDYERIKSLLDSKDVGDIELAKVMIIQRANWYMWDNILIRDSPDFGVYCAGWSQHEVTELCAAHERPPDRDLIPPERLLRIFSIPFADLLSHESVLNQWGHSGTNMESLCTILEEYWWKFHEGPLIKGVDECLKSVSTICEINKVVCIGLGRPVVLNCAVGSSTMQHVLAKYIKLQVEKIQNRTVELYAADPMYDRVTVDGLAASGFKILDNTYQHHEAFTMVDDSTFYITIETRTLADYMVLEYARPAAMIIQSIKKDVAGIEDPRTEPYYHWHEVLHPLTRRVTVELPGPPRRLPFSPKWLWDILDEEYNHNPAFPTVTADEEKFWHREIGFYARNPHGDVIF
ncbi:putative SRR1-like domain-containing protein [Seiridium cardinale]|uniref:SRR1-like domain-containing protein n=1 Tax=Seiridium cardinale TaxID=138064 RepID=A0ABR2XE34_9PEZI